MEIELLYEDAYCLVVNKPSNLLVHHSYYARNIDEQSLLQLLRDQGHPSVFPVHRLDRKTSGLLLLAKDREYVPAFQALFDQQEIAKKYLALLRGHVVSSGEISSPVKNDRGNYKEALTLFRTIQHLELDIPVQPYPTARYSLVELTPKTGRMHQLRIHANKISHPIIGDPKYGNRHHNHMFAETLGLTHLFLHAHALTFTHPFTGQQLELQARLPENWKAFPAAFDSHFS